MKQRAILLVAGVGATALAPMPAQFTFAILGIGVIGMIHGAGDLAMVEPTRRSSFLIIYGLISLATLLCWTTEPAVALPAFLACSAVHFGIEDAPNASLLERVARGVALIMAPATVHATGYAALLHTAGGTTSGLGENSFCFALAGGVASVALLGLAWTRGDRRLAGGVAALLLLPPLIGFTTGFLILHALPQTAARRDLLGYSSTLTYLRAVAPIFVAALLLGGIVVTLLLRYDPSGVRGLFAAIAALATPHLLVTPWFERRVAADHAPLRVR